MKFLVRSGYPRGIKTLNQQKARGSDDIFSGLLKAGFVPRALIGHPSYRAMYVPFKDNILLSALQGDSAAPARTLCVISLDGPGKKTSLELSRGCLALAKLERFVLTSISDFP